MTIGLFFGSFNPIHIGHLIIANVMIQNTDIDKVWFVVSPHNPLKKRTNLLHEQDRMDMVRVAIDDNYDMQPCNVEFSMPKPSYTIDTLAYLTDKHPNKDFRLIIGEDNLSHFHKWKNYKQILDFGLYTYPRPHTKHTDIHHHPKVNLVDAPMVDISATFIRKCIRSRKSIKYLVPYEVEEMISSRGYYIN